MLFRSAVRTLIERYPMSRTVGIGDAWNDVPLLREVDIPILLASLDMDRMHVAVPAARVTSAPGPEGWNSALLELLKEQS